MCYGEDLSVTLLNVGQADSILVQTAGKRVLIDAGETSTQARDILKSKGIQSLDLVVATHPHADHIGGMKNVVEAFNIKVYLDNGFPHTTSMYTKLMEAVENKVSLGQMRYIKGRKGQRLNFGPEAYFEILWPDDVGLSGTRSDINSNSVILKLTHKDVCFAFMGDAEAETETKVIQAIGKCQVLKVSHHGSPHSSIPELIQTLHPQIALISVGLGNKHGHPGPRVIEELSAIGTQIYRTDLMGEITAISDGTNVRVTTEHAPLTLTKININLADIKGLKELPGVGDKTAQAIIDYRSINGPYKTIEDVYKADPKSKKRFDKIIPYITVSGGSATSLIADDSNAAPSTPAPIAVANSNAVAPTTIGGSRVNINTADEAALAAMPGMSATKAKAAVADRNANGPFQSCADLTRVKGIGQKTVDKLLDVCTTQGAGNPSATVNPASNQIPVVAPKVAPSAPTQVGGAININTADEATLAAMPGMNATKAKAAIADRNANGPFQSCADLTRVKGIGQKTVDKLLSSCTVE